MRNVIPGLRSETMKKISTLAFGLFLWGLNTSVIYAQITVTANTDFIGTYDVYELTIQHPVSYSNNWEDVTVTASFHGPREIHIDGFFYNTNVWKVRFAPPVAGNWTYDLSFATLSTTFTSGGIFTCVTSSTKGFLRQHPHNPFRLIFPDGTLFNGIGIGDCILDGNNNGTPHDDWGFDGDFRPPSPAEGDRTDLNTYLNAYGAFGAGFNLFRWSIDNCAFNLYDSLTVNGNAYFIREGMWGDTLVQSLRQHGFRIWTSFFGFDPPYPNLITIGSPEEDAIKRYIRYVVARYGAYIDIWELYNEATTTDHWIYEIVPFIHSIDPYGRLIATSWQRPDHPDIDINAPHWYEKESEFASDERAWSEITNKKSWNKPIIFGEQGNSVQNWDPLSALRMRIRSWTAFFAEGIFIFWNSTFAKDYFNPIAANIYLGPEERGYIRALQDFTSVADSSIHQMTITPSNPTAVRGYGLQSPKVILGYFHHYSSHSTSVSTSFNLTLDQPSTVYWINPADNGLIKAENLSSGNQFLISPPFPIDLAMWISSGITGTNDPSTLNNEITVYPNPAHQGFYIHGIKDYPAQVELYTISGDKIMSGDIRKEESVIRVGDLSEGLYIIKITTRDKLPDYEKLVIHH